VVWETVLKEAFPNLYSITCVKDASIAIQLELSSGFLPWNVSFIRTAHDWELDVFVSLFNLMYSYRVRREGEDKLWWAPSKKGCLLLATSTMSLSIMMAFLSVGRVFGALRFL
jgi:hypothetical protein